MKKIIVFTHKKIWKSDDSPLGWATDGGFVFHMSAINSLFNEMELIAPEIKRCKKGEIIFKDNDLTITPFQFPFRYGGWVRKINVLIWTFYNFKYIISKIKNADIVHIPLPSDFGTIGMLVAKLLNKPLFIRHCGNWYKPRTISERFWKFFMIKYTRNKIVSFATGGGTNYPSKKNKNIKWIFSTSLLAKEFDKIISFNNDINKKIKIIIVARQIKEKGTEILLNSLVILNDKRIELTVIGDGEDLNYFKKLKKKLNLINKIEFLGKLNNSEVINRLLESDLFCFPTYSSEGFPKVVLEAMACSLPVISTKVSVLPNLIESNKCGVILKKTCHKELAKEIHLLINNKRRMNEMSINAKKAAKKFSLENWADYIAKELSLTYEIKIKRYKEILK